MAHEIEYRNTAVQCNIPIHYFSHLQIQISAYLDNVFDVAALMEDSETKTAALERVAELEDELALVSSSFWYVCIFIITRLYQNILR